MKTIESLKLIGKIVLMSALLTGAQNESRAVDYRESGLATTLEEPSELQPENIRVLSELPWAGGRVLLEVGADVRNLGDAFWEAVSLHVRDEIAGATPVMLNSIIHFAESSAPGQVINAAETLFTIIRNSDLPAARNELMNGSVLQIFANTMAGVASETTSNLVVDAARIVAETPLANGLTLIEFAAGVRNIGTNNWTNVTVNLDHALGSIAYRQPLFATTYTNRLGAFGVATGLDSMLLTVSSNELPTVRSNLLSGAGLSYAGDEMWVFSAFPRCIDAATEDAWRQPAESAGNGEMRLVFTNRTTLLLALQPGDLLLENPAINKLQVTVLDDPLDPFDDNQPLLAYYLPFSVSSVSLVSSNEVHVVGRQKRLNEVVKSATFIADALDAYDRPVRHPYDPTLENTYTEKEQEEREKVALEIEAEDPRDGRLADLKGMVSIPVHFNETFLSDKVKVSGELLFRQSGLKLEVKIREFQLQRAVARMDAGAVFNLVIECFEKEDTTDVPEEEKSKNLLPFKPLPALKFNLGGVPVSVQPEISLTAGVDANVPTSITLPLQSVFTVGMEMGFDRSLKTGTNDGFFYRPITEFIPIRVSDPTVFDELAASISPWAELGLGLKIGIGEGVSLQAGPSLGIRLGNNFTLAPIGNPWWSLDSGIDLIGRFNMALDFLGFGSVDLVDASASLQHFNLFHRDAGGPLIRGMRASAVGAGTSMKPLLGKNTRWGRVFEPFERFGLSSGFAFVVPGSPGEIIAGGSGAISDVTSMFAKFDADGDLLWMKDNQPLGGATMRRAAPLADGTFFTAGSRGLDIVFSRFDKDGNRLWGASFRPALGFAVTGVAARTNEAGQAEFFVTGFVNHTGVRDSDPLLIKLDANGNVLWSVYYAFPGDDEAHGINVSLDGNVLVCGYTAADVAPAQFGTPDADNMLKNIVASGLVMKVDAVSGSVLWANAIASRWGMIFTSILEAPDHSIYAGGGAGKIVTQDRPCNLFAKFDSEGNLIDHVLVGDDPDFLDELPNGGSTPYDTVRRLIWTPEGLAACGVTGLGTGTAGWVLGLTEELGVRFYTIFDGSDSEELMDIADGTDGLVVIGNTRTAYPFGVGTHTSPFLLKLPWEGIMRFHENSRLRSLYLQPRVYHSSGTTEFQILSRNIIPNAPPMVFANTYSAVTFTNSPLALTPATSPSPFKPSAVLLIFSLERLDKTLAHDYASWAAYYQLPPGSSPDDDTDGDGQANIVESYFGQSPWAPDTTSPFTLSLQSNNAQSTAVIEFTRSKFAQSYKLNLESSADLTSWLGAQGFTETVQPLDSTTDHVRLTGPSDGSRRFFRIGVDFAQ